MSKPMWGGDDSWGGFIVLSENAIYSYSNVGPVYQERAKKALKGKTPNKVWNILKGFPFTKAEVQHAVP